MSKQHKGVWDVTVSYVFFRLEEEMEDMNMDEEMKNVTVNNEGTQKTINKILYLCRFECCFLYHFCTTWKKKFVELCIDNGK